MLDVTARRIDATVAGPDKGGAGCFVAMQLVYVVWLFCSGAKEGCLRGHREAENPTRVHEDPSLPWLPFLSSFSSPPPSVAQTYPTCLFGSTIAPVATRNSLSLSRKAGAGGHEVRDHELTGEVSERIPLDHTTRYLVPRALQPNHPQIRDPFAFPRSHPRGPGSEEAEGWARANQRRTWPARAS